MSELREVKEIFEKIASVSSKKSKEIILKQNENNELFKECLKFLLDDNVVTGLSTKKFNKKVEIYNITFENILDAFEYVKEYNTGTDVDISMIKTFCSAQGDCKEFCKKLFTKKLKIGCDSKTVNKVIKGLIPEFNIMLGSKFDFDKPPKGTMYISEKLDGIRCVAIIENKKVKLYSRQGKLILGLVDIEQELSRMFSDAFIDGELLAMDCGYEDVYKETTKRVNNKNKEKHGVKYVIYDAMTLDEFNNKKCNLCYSDRRDILESYRTLMFANDFNFISILPLIYTGDDVNRVLNLLSEYKNIGAEGLMCNLDKPYEFKRTKNLLKLKVMQSCDLKIIGFEEGQGRLKNTLGKLICDYKGFELGVGSGFSDELRNEIWNNQNKYLGRVSEIQYFEETHNDKNELSLRFPVFKCIREEGKVVSYE